jgi:hypothetical protein
VIPWLDHPSGDPWDLVAACLACNMRKKQSIWQPGPRTHEALQAVLDGVHTWAR